MSKVTTYLFYLLLVLLVLSYFGKGNYRSIKEIDPPVLNEPIQEETTEPVISFSKDDFSYKLEPVSSYELNALLVHKFNYRFFSLSKNDNAFPMDLCVTWGENVQSGVFREKDLKIRQDSRWCFYRWSGDLKVNVNEISNNHLIFKDPSIQKKLNKLQPGDQIKITGYLVNVLGVNNGKIENFNPESVQMKTSTSRDDQGAGACEIIYVENLEILKPGHPWWVLLFKVSFYGLILIILIKFGELFRPPPTNQDYLVSKEELN